MLVRWGAQKKYAPDPRSMRDRPLAVVMLDFYRHHGDRLESLEDLMDHGKLGEGEFQELVGLRDLLDEAPLAAPDTLLEKIEDHIQNWSTSGDPVIDEWDAMLENGEVPDDFWGPNGPPVDRG